MVLNTGSCEILGVRIGVRADTSESSKVILESIVRVIGVYPRSIRLLKQIKVVRCVLVVSVLESGLNICCNEKMNE